MSSREAVTASLLCSIAQILTVKRFSLSPSLPLACSFAPGLVDVPPGDASLGSASVETMSKGSVPPSPTKRASGSVGGWEVDLKAQVGLSSEMLKIIRAVEGVPADHHVHPCYAEGGQGSYYAWLLEEEERVRKEEEERAEEERLKAAAEKEKRKKKKSKKKK